MSPVFTDMSDKYAPTATDAGMSTTGGSRAICYPYPNARPAENESAGVVVGKASGGRTRLMRYSDGPVSRH